MIEKQIEFIFRHPRTLSKKRQWLKMVENVVDFFSENNLITSRLVRLNVVFVDKREIAQLNEKYRNKPEATDVLSFLYEKNRDLLEGELIIALDIVKDNASADKIPWSKELLKNIIHGLLHLAGYQHGPEMFAWQDKILTLYHDQFKEIN